jgi:hypothetical protein
MAIVQPIKITAMRHQSALVAAHLLEADFALVTWANVRVGRSNSRRKDAGVTGHKPTSQETSHPRKQFESI